MKDYKLEDLTEIDGFELLREEYTLNGNRFYHIKDVPMNLNLKTEYGRKYMELYLQLLDMGKNLNLDQIKFAFAYNAISKLMER